MSNEFLMVPRAELVRLQENMDPHRGAVAWGIVCDMLAKPAEQSQGEPVVMPERKKTSEYPFPMDSSRAYGWNACLDEIAKLGPLYTHADPGEVERMRADYEKLWCDFVKVDDENDKLREGMRGDYDLDAWLDFAKERKTLLAQLAERDALLRELDDAWNSHDGKERFYKLMAKIEVLPASAEPSAPVEHDERAAFEAWFKDHSKDWPFPSESIKSIARDNDWLVWQARAALERKPS